MACYISCRSVFCRIFQAICFTVSYIHIL